MNLKGDDLYVAKAEEIVRSGTEDSTTISKLCDEYVKNIFAFNSKEPVAVDMTRKDVVHDRFVCAQTALDEINDSRRANSAIKSVPDKIEEALKLHEDETTIMRLSHYPSLTKGEQKVFEYIQSKGYSPRLQPGGLYTPDSMNIQW